MVTYAQEAFKQWALTEIRPTTPALKTSKVMQSRLRTAFKKTKQMKKKRLLKLYSKVGVYHHDDTEFRYKASQSAYYSSSFISENTLNKTKKQNCIVYFVCLAFRKSPNNPNKQNYKIHSSNTPGLYVWWGLLKEYMFNKITDFCFLCGHFIS